MAISVVAIANRALQKLGADRIEDLGEDSPNARTMNAAYEITRDAELRRYRWGFSIKRVSIPQDPEDTVWGDWSRFSLPGDYLSIIRDDETGRSVDWRIEGLHIVTADDAPLDLRYVSRVTDPTFFDSLFIEALASKLAMETCQEVTQSTSKKKSAKDDYKTAIADAKLAGAIEKPAQGSPEDDWIAARR